MKAEIKYIHSPDVPDLKNYLPEEKDNFGFLIQMMVGLRDKEGEESFDMMVCTPKWLTQNHKKEEVLFGRHYVVVFEYNYERIYHRLKKFVESLEGDNWDSLGQQISRIGRWEFEDYQDK